MKPLPCRILFGPLYHAPILGHYLANPQLKCFAPQETVRITERHALRPLQADLGYAPEAPFETLWQAVADWEPEILIWYNLALMPPPVGIEKAPCPTVAVIHDWHLNLQACLDYAQAFDFVLADRAFVQILQAQGQRNCAWWPCYAHDPSTHYLIPGLVRDYDLTFLGNLDYHYHRERNHWLERVMRSLLSDTDQATNQPPRLLFSDRHYGFDYTRILNRSKIVFNRSIRGEMNMRAYEALACGALLFMEEENLEVRDFLRDGVSCVLYNADNLAAKLQYYLSHPAERQAIAAQGLVAIQQFTPERQFERLLELLPQIRAAAQKRQGPRAFSAAPASWQALVRARQIFYARSPEAHQQAQALLTRASQSGTAAEQEMLQAAQAALQLNAHWLPTSLWQPHALPAEAHQALQQLQHSVRAFPQNLLLEYNLAAALTLHRRPAEALPHWHNLRQTLPAYPLSLPQLSWQILLPTGHHQHLSDFGHLWNQVLGAVLLGQQPVSALKRLLLWQICEQSGYCLLYAQRPHEALSAFQEAETHWPGNYFTYAPMLHLLAAQERWSELLAALRRAVQHLGLAEALQRDYLLTLHRLRFQQPELEPEYQRASHFYRHLLNCFQGGGSWARHSLHGWLPQLMAHLPEHLAAEQSLTVATAKNPTAEVGQD